MPECSATGSFGGWLGTHALARVDRHRHRPVLGRVLTQPETLLWIANVVGAFAGMMDGLYRIHNFGGLGWLCT